MDETPSSQHSAPVRTENFYFDYDPMAIFLVENQLFRVHRHYFIEGSQIFRDMFSQASNCEEAEGMSDDEPIVLPNVTVKEFRTLLRYFYTMTPPILKDKTLPFEQDEKLALLSIAHKFVFDNIFEYISGEFEPETFSVADRVRLGDKYGLKIWLSSAYQNVLERTPDQNLSREEVDALGLERTVKILETKNSILHEVHDQNLKELQSNVTLHKIHCRRCGTSHSEYCFPKNSTENPTAMKSAVAREVQKLLRL